MNRKITAALAATCLVGVGVGLVASAGAASAAVPPAGDSALPYAMVAWQMPDTWETTGWFPQTYAAETFLATGDGSNLHALDATLATLPGCHDYQIDIYPNNENTAAYIAGLVAGGTLQQGQDYGLTGAWDIRQDIGLCNTTTQFGGLTLGYYKNHTVSDDAWNAVRSAYPNLFGTGTGNWTKAGKPLLSVNGSTNNGLDMLKAQFLATALRVAGTPGFGTQGFNVPAGTAVDGGTTVLVNDFLADVNTRLGSDPALTKAQITSVASVLDAINQDAISGLFV